MLTILSALGGLATSLLPDLIHGILGQRQDTRDKAQELAILRLQVERETAAGQREAAAQAGRLAEIEVQADIAESAALNQRVAVVGVPWVDALNASVRPVVTYCFFALFTWHMGAGILGWPSGSGVWDAEVQALFAGIMGFWFGARAMRHAKGG
jgi:hypothetical protein